MDGHRTTQLALLGVVVIGVLTGCAAIRRSQALDTEQLLAAAGFRMQPADTAQQQQQLQAMPPYRLVSRTRGDGVEYTYADPENCTCVYVGGPAEYSEYRRLVRQRQVAEEELWAAGDAWTGWGWGSGRGWW